MPKELRVSETGERDDGISLVLAVALNRFLDDEEEAEEDEYELAEAA